VLGWSKQGSGCQAAGRLQAQLADRLLLRTRNERSQIACCFLFGTTTIASNLHIMGMGSTTAVGFYGCFMVTDRESAHFIPIAVSKYTLKSQILAMASVSNRMIHDSITAFQMSDRWIRRRTGTDSSKSRTRLLDSRLVSHVRLVAIYL
jgi:hypothetical protein